MFKKVYRVLDDRLNLKPVLSVLLDEGIPGGASWVYVFGSATLFIFVSQMITGIFLALYYVPTPDHAYASIQYINTEVALGYFVRGLHHWGASAMVIVIGLHMLQVYLYGAYKPPRDIMWHVGIFLFMITLVFAFTGYLLPWDQTAYWATKVGINMTATIPIIGDFVAKTLRGGPEQGALTLSRFFAIHVMVLPWTIVGLIALHLFVLRRVGPAGPCADTQSKDFSEPFWPRQVYMDLVIALGIFVVLATVAATIERPLAPEADLSDTSFVPVPEWYFLFYYELLKHLHGPALEVVATTILPILFFGTLFALPYLGKREERCPTRRPVAVIAMTLFLIGVFALMAVSIQSTRLVAVTDPGVITGKKIYAQLQCAGCHRIHGDGVNVGPDLSLVGTKHDADWLKQHFKDPQALVPGSIMPKYDLSEEDLNNLTAYMLSLK